MTAYNTQNIFAKIIRGELPCKKVYESEDAIAFHDITPSAAVHVLVIPKGEYTSFDDFMEGASQEIAHRFFSQVREIAHKLGLRQSGYRLITNHGEDACQTIGHFHVHILGKQALGPLTDKRYMEGGR